jgi:hypothetical protein
MRSAMKPDMRRVATCRIKFCLQCQSLLQPSLCEYQLSDPESLVCGFAGQGYIAEQACC